MVSLNVHRKVTIYTRISVGIVSGASLALFVAILVKVFDPLFPSVKPGYSALPVGALAFSILWNLVALATIGKLGRFFHPAGDSIVTVVLIVLGAVGFAHDDRAYLSNGMYEQYDNDPWLGQAIGAGSLLILVVIIQLFLVVWNFIKPGRKTNSDCLVSHPPAYFKGDYVKDVKDKEFEVDWQSVSSLEIPPSVMRKDMEKV